MADQTELNTRLNTEEEEERMKLERMLERSQKSAKLHAAREHAERLDERLRGLIAAMGVSQNQDSTTVCLGRESFLTVTAASARRMLEVQRMRLTDEVAEAWQRVAVIEKSDGM